MAIKNWQLIGSFEALGEAGPFRALDELVTQLGLSILRFQGDGPGVPIATRDSAEGPAMAADREPVRGTYQHYKGAFYEVLGMAEDPETGQHYVVYQSLGISENLLDTEEAGPHLGHRVIRNASKGALAVCSVARFTESVDGKQYSGGKPVPRFKLIAAMPAEG